jgi:hypothetical protein
LNLATYGNLVQIYLFINMGKQYNKVIKRRRRAAYIAKRKAAVKELVGKSTKTSKPKASKPKATRKPAAKKPKVAEEKPDKVSEKANPVDVLGPDDVVSEETAVNEVSTEGPKVDSKDSESS